MSYSKLTLDLRSYQQDTNSHSHDYHQLILPIKGELEIDINRHSGVVTNNKAALVSAEKEHGFSSQSENSFVVANIPQSLAPEFERLPEFITLDPSLSQYVIFLHQQLKQGAGQSEQQMLLLLIQLLQEKHGEKLKIDKRIDAAHIYLEQHFDKNISLEKLGIIANLSPRQLSELFKQQFSMTPQQYLIEKRMQVAWQLLKNSRQSIQQVSETIGYSNLSAFSHRFKKHFNVSPSYFRQNGKQYC